MTDNTMTLAGVNVPPAQTWNYLRINETSFEVPVLPDDLEGVRPDSAAFADVEMSAGEAATAWLDLAADFCAWLPEASGVAHVEVGGPVTATDVSVPDGAELTLYVTATPEAGGNADDGQLAALAGEGYEHSAESLACGLLSGHALRIRAGARSRVSLVGVYAMGGLPYLESVGVELGEGASLDVRQYVLSGAKTALGIAVDQRGERCEANVTCRYLVHGGEDLDMNYLARMRGRDTTCRLLFSGVLEEGARKNLCDTIDLCHGAKGADGLENETVLLSSGNVVNKSLPTILCDEDDVAGNHGATIGSVSPEQLAYLAGRGLDEREATELFSRAVVDDAAAHANEQGLAAVIAFAREALGDEVADELAETYADTL